MWVAGPNITPGYWNRPDATAAAFEGRWLKTGDAARRDDEGFYYIVDRWKDMYISGGENVYPAEVENVLYQLPQIAEAAVIGVPSEQWGEVGLAVLAVKPGQHTGPGHGPRALRANAGALQVPAPTSVHRRAAAQRHRQGAQARAAPAIRRQRRAGHQLNRASTLRARTRRAARSGVRRQAPPRKP